MELRTHSLAGQGAELGFIVIAVGSSGKGLIRVSQSFTFQENPFSRQTGQQVVEEVSREMMEAGMKPWAVKTDIHERTYERFLSRAVLGPFLFFL